MERTVLIGLVLSLLLCGCTSYGLVQNTALDTVEPPQGYSIKSLHDRAQGCDIRVVLSFSGGGTRAAALAYGVLQELRDTPISIQGKPARLLDEVKVISSVSGGSFTAAYYGLFGDRIFTDFEGAFLREDVEDVLIHMALNPLRWFRDTERTTWAVEFYQQQIFKGATFADMNREDRPLIVINASDLGGGVRFSFLQEYFDLLCSDLSTFPVARAVAASSAVPVVFHPVVVQNYSDCGDELPEWLSLARSQTKGNEAAGEIFEGLESFLAKEQRKYIHLVDGGITDNLGLRALLEVVAMEGGINAHFDRVNLQPPRHTVVIAVNASTEAQSVMDRSNKQPSMMDTINAMSDIQLHRYNTATLEAMQQQLVQWEKALSTPERPISAQFVQVDLRDIQDPALRDFINRVPTSFSLTGEQVDKMIAAGRQLLRDNPEFRELLATVGTWAAR